MNAYSLSLYSFSVWTVFIAVFIAYRRHDEISYRWLGFSLLASFWAIGWGLMLDNRTTTNQALTAVRFATITGLIVPVAWLDFCYAFLRLQKPKRIMKYLYISSVLAAILSFSHLMIKNMAPYLEFNHHAVAGPIYFIKDISFFGFVLFGFFLMKRRLNSAAGSERQTLRLFLFATATGFAGCSITHFSIYGFKVPHQIILLLPLFPFLMVGTLLNHRLLDVNELSHLAKEAKLATLGTLSASILHEVKNPLYLMKNIAVSNSNPSTEESQKALEKVEKHSARALEMIERFKTYASTNGDRSDRLRINLDCEAILDSALELVSPVMKARNIALKRYRTNEAAAISGDPINIEQIFVNLIQNAYEAVPDEGTVEISTRTDLEQVEIEIKDNGAGISHEDQKHIFEPFHTTKLGRGGTGLGLFITKRLVEAEGGRITIKSFPSKGSTFTVRFKVAK